MPWIEIQKVNKSQNLLENQYVLKHVLNHISMYKIAKFLLRPWAEIKTKYFSHKRTLWIEEFELKFRKKGKQEDSKGDKSTKAQKSAKWHGNEEQTDISIYHMLRSCGV